MSRRYSWSRFPDAAEYRCKETGEKVSYVMIEEAMIHGDFSKIPKGFLSILADLMRKERTRLANAVSRCLHTNKVDVSQFDDSMPMYTCLDCGWNTPRPRKLSELELTAIAVAEGEALVRSWKEKEKHDAELLEADKVLKEVHRVKGRK